jgi:hypothetical protein
MAKGIITEPIRCNQPVSPFQRKEELLRRMIATTSGAEDFRFSGKDDGSFTQRLYNLAGAMRHTEKAIASCRVIQGSRSPVWLTKEGIESEVGRLRYSIILLAGQTSSSIQLRCGRRR